MATRNKEILQNVQIPMQAEQNAMDFSFLCDKINTEEVIECLLHPIWSSFLQIATA